MNALQAVADAVVWLGELPGSAILILLFAFMFAWTGATKLLEPVRTAETVVRLGLARKTSKSLGYGAAALELVLALWLLSGVASRIAMAFASILLLGFALAMFVKIREGSKFACFCFGNSDHEIGYLSVVRNLGLAALGLVVAFGATAQSVLDASFTDGYLATIVAISVFMSIFIGSYAPKLLKDNQGTVRYLRLQGGDQ